MPEQKMGYADHDRPMTNAPYLVENTVSSMRPNTIRPIQIEQLNHGYIIRVGSQNFAIESASTLVAKLAEYINNPTETEGKWEAGKLF